MGKDNENKTVNVAVKKKQPSITRFKSISKMPMHFTNNGKDINLHPGQEVDLLEDAYILGLEGQLFIERLTKSSNDNTNSK